uniref:Uncharacterized protein n=1 Tax=Anguilla anguilla TaxID=7936 RepID=A0A0E9RIB5_ANGAN
MCTQALLSHSPLISQIRIPSVLSVLYPATNWVGMRLTINYCVWWPMLIGGPTEAGCRAINLPSHLTVVPEAQRVSLCLTQGKGEKWAPGSCKTSAVK